MNGRRIGALALRIIRQFRRDRRTLALLIVAPILVLSLLGYIYRGASHTVTLAVVNQGDSPLASQIIDGLKNDQALRVEEMDAPAALTAVDAGDVDAVLTLPSDLQLQPGAPPETIRVTLEGSQPSVSSTVLTALNRTLPETLIKTINPEGLPIRIEPEFLHGGPQYDQLDYLAPSFIGFFAFFFIFLLTSVSFLRERIQGSIERLIVSPLRRSEMVIGYMLGFGLFAAIQCAVLVLFSVYILRIHYAGNLALVFLFTLLLALGSVNLGIYLSTYARTELQVVQFIPLVIVPQAFLSGVIWSISSLPDPLRWLAYLMPLTYANEALRGVMIRADGLANLWVDGLVLVGFAVLMVLLGASTLHREVA